MKLSFTNPIFFGLLFFIIAACNRDDISTQYDSITVNQLSEQDAQQQFAIILSKTVSHNEPLRKFIKNTALKEFDKDFDVFYPYVKNETIEAPKTFRDLLLENTDEEILSAIEQRLPKLTILVPEFSWVNENCFSVKSWDTSSEQVAVGFDDCMEKHPVYYDGELLGSLPARSFPSFPVLIVKSNERMKVLPSTKGGEFQYDFVSPNYDGSKTNETKAAWGWTQGDKENPSEDDKVDLVSVIGNYISYNQLNSISPETVEAYNEFGTGWNGGVQRDYIYYGMNQTNSDNGRLNMFKKDLVYRVALNWNGITDMSDATGDPGMDLHTGRDDRPGFTKALERIWGGGKYDLSMEFFQDSKNSGTGSLGSFDFSVSPDKLMYVEKCHYTFQWNFFGNNWSHYYLEEDGVKPKWYYPGDDGLFYLIENHWALASSSDNLWVKITEKDNEETITQSSTKTFKFSPSISTNYNVSGGTDSVKVGYGVSGTFGMEWSKSSTFSYSIKTGSDDLGNCFIDYIDNIVTAKTGNGYQMKRIGTGYFMFSLLPIDTRNEYQIRQRLLSRTPQKTIGD